MTTTPNQSGGNGAVMEAGYEASLDDFIFAWFNEREPAEMQACLEAYDGLRGISHD